MALSEIWTDKIDGVDYINADDINMVAQAVIQIEEDNGNIEAALDAILAIQEAYIGGSV